MLSRRLSLPVVFLFLLLTAACLVSPAWAQNRSVPYWASLSAPEVNLRVGPGERYPVRWVYRREGLPVKVLRLQQGWRLIEEPDGTRGWVFNQLLSRQRHAIVIGEGLAALRELPDPGSALRWNLEPGVIGRLGDCEANWCELDIDGRRGWVARNRIWGAGEP